MFLISLIIRFILPEMILRRRNGMIPRRLFGGDGRRLRVLDHPAEVIIGIRHILDKVLQHGVGGGIIARYGIIPGYIFIELLKAVFKAGDLLLFVRGALVKALGIDTACIPLREIYADPIFMYASLPKAVP